MGDSTIISTGRSKSKLYQSKIKRKDRLQVANPTVAEEEYLTVFLKFSISDYILDKEVIISLHRTEVNKKSVDNFYHLCVGDKGIDLYTSNKLHYKNGKIHRISRFFIQGGDINEGDGSGMTSIYNSDFFETNSNLEFNLPDRQVEYGDLFASNLGPNTSNSQFFILSKIDDEDPFFENLHKKYIYMGKVISGFDTVRKISLQPTNTHTLEPYPKIKIQDCGAIPDPDIFNSTNK